MNRLSAMLVVLCISAVVADDCYPGQRCAPHWSDNDCYDCSPGMYSGTYSPGSYPKSCEVPASCISCPSGRYSYGSRTSSISGCTPLPTAFPTAAPTAAPTMTIADLKASATDSAPHLLKAGHDALYAYNPAVWTMTPETACGGRNELGSQRGITLAEAKTWCEGNAACVSFEQEMQTGQFQFSTSCTVSISSTLAGYNYDLYVIDRTTADGKLLDGHNIGNITNGKTDANFVKAETEYKGAVNGFTDANMPFMTKAMKMRYNKVLEEDAKRDTPALAAKIPYIISALFHGKTVSQGSCPATVPAFANGVNGAKVVGKGPHGAHDENQSGSIVPVDCADGFVASPEGSNPLVFQRCEPVPKSKRVYAWVAHGTCDATSAPTKAPTNAPTNGYTKLEKSACAGRNEMDAIFKADGKRASTNDAITLDEAKALCDEYPACVSFEVSPSSTQFSSSCKENKATTYSSISLYVKV